MSLSSNSTLLSAFITRYNVILKELNPQIDRSAGTVLMDIGRDSNAQEFVNDKVLVEFLRLMSSTTGITQLLADTSLQNQIAEAMHLSNVGYEKYSASNYPTWATTDFQAFLYDAINLFGANFQLTRTAATKSQFVQYFFLNSPVAVQVPIGTFAKKTDGTTPHATITSSLQTPQVYSNVDSPWDGFPYVTEIVEASASGVSNPPIGSLSVATGSLPTSVVGTSNVQLIQAGVDIETNASFLARCEAKATGRVFGTISGYRSWTMEQTGVQDAAVVDPSSAICLRGTGTADIYIKGAILTQVTEIFPYDTGEALHATVARLLSHQPVESIVSGATLVPDTGTFLRSVNEKSYASFLNEVVGTTVVYQYYQNVFDLQGLLEVPENEMVAADVLIKAAYSASLIINYEVTPSVGYTTAEANIACDAAITTFFEDVGLGYSFIPSDLEEALLALPEVRQIKETTFGFKAWCPGLTLVWDAATLSWIAGTAAYTMLGVDFEDRMYVALAATTHYSSI